MQYNVKLVLKCVIFLYRCGAKGVGVYKWVRKENTMSDQQSSSKDILSKLEAVCSVRCRVYMYCVPSISSYNCRCPSRACVFVFCLCFQVPLYLVWTFLKQAASLPDIYNGVPVWLIIFLLRLYYWAVLWNSTINITTSVGSWCRFTQV